MFFFKYDYKKIEMWKEKKKTTHLLKALRLSSRKTDKNDLCKIVSALGDIKDPKAVDHLVELLSNEDCVWQRGKIVNALGNIGSEKAIEPLVKLLADKSNKSNCRYDIITSLGKIKSKLSLQYLCKYLDEPNYESSYGSISSSIADLVSELDWDDIESYISINKLNAPWRPIIFRNITQKEHLSKHLLDVEVLDYGLLEEIIDNIDKNTHIEHKIKKDLIRQLEERLSHLRPYHLEEQYVECSICDGKGWWKGMDTTDCQACGGTGEQLKKVKVYHD